MVRFPKYHLRNVFPHLSDDRVQPLAGKQDQSMEATLWRHRRLLSTMPFPSTLLSRIAI